MKSKKIAISFIVVILSIALIGIGGYWVYNHFVVPKSDIVFEETNERTEIVSLNKSIERTSFTHIATIQNSSNQDIVVKSIDVENSNELQPYINTLTLTVGNTSLIAKDLTKDEIINLSIPASGSVTIMVEYSLKNLDDNCPDTIELAINT